MDKSTRQKFITNLFIVLKVLLNVIVKM